MKLDITMTAVRRPKILEKTLASFRMNLFKPNLHVDYQLIVNVDPIGEMVPLSYIHDVCADFFPHPILVTQPEPHFGVAFHRVWSIADYRQTFDWKPSFVFHLEDDWECTRSVDLYKMIDCMRDKKVAMLRLSTVNALDTDFMCIRQWGHTFPYNGRFYEIPDEDTAKLRVSGHPSLINPIFIHEVLPHLDPKKNPEKQMSLSHPYIGPIIKRYQFGVYTTPGLPANIKDLGRDWMVKAGFTKQGNKGWFTQWEVTNAREEGCISESPCCK